MGMKRPYQLMLGDCPNPPKMSKATQPVKEQPGPTIHELSPECILEDNCTDTDDNFIIEPIDLDPDMLIQEEEVSDEPHNIVAEEINPLSLLNTGNSSNSLQLYDNMESQDKNEDTLKFLLSSNEKNKKFDAVNEDLEVPDLLFATDDNDEQNVDDPGPLVSGGISLTNNNQNNNLSLIKREIMEPSNNSSKNMTLATVSSGSDNRHSLSRLASVDDVDDHLDHVQGELDSLRDLLKGEGYSLDANTLLGVRGASSSKSPMGLTVDSEVLLKLFGVDDPLSYGISMNPSDLNLDEAARYKNENELMASGAELMAYTPGLLDFSDMWDVGTSPIDEPIENIPSELNTPQVALSAPDFNKYK